jgi:F-type H+-transporting ATPase subunit epsilon
MSTFYLKIVTAERQVYEGEVDSIVVRTTEGDVGIRANHENYAAVLALGRFEMRTGEQVRKAAVSGGFIEYSDNVATIVARTFEWREEIDRDHIKSTIANAEAAIAAATTDEERKLNEFRKKVAENRIRLLEEK